MKIYREVKVSDRLPKEKGVYYCKSSIGMDGTYFFDGNSFKYLYISSFFEEVELPSDDDVIAKVREVYVGNNYGSTPRQTLFEQGANYILNFLKK